MQRLRQLQQTVQQKGLSGLLVSKPQNVRYLSQYVGTNGQLLVTPRKVTLITDFRYLRSARKQIPKEVAIFDQKDGLWRLFKSLCSLGFEDHEVSYSFFKKLKKEFPKIRFIPSSGVVEEMRMIKASEELRILRQACRIADESLRRLIKTIRVGISEDELTWNLLSIARELGADGFSFPPIICFGKNTADVHHIKEDNRLKAGESVLIDMGIEYRGYMTDMTRTFYTRKPTKIEQKIYSTVLHANQEAIRAIAVGKTTGDIDRVAREIIERTGYGDRFGHSTGHGVGMEVHEAPTVSAKSKELIQPGMIFTVEPGIYIDHLGGVRIEDMILVNEKGIEALTKSPKELQVLSA